VFQEIVAQQDHRTDDEARAPSQELSAGQDHHAGADHPDHLQRYVDSSAGLGDAGRGERPAGRNDENFQDQQPHASRHQK
jgi:hypothetical protein